MGFEQEHSHSVCEQRLNRSVVGKQSIVCNLFTEVHARNEISFPFARISLWSHFLSPFLFTAVSQYLLLAAILF